MLKLLPWLLAMILLIFYITGTIVYRLFFHPLAKYPGPFLAKITSLYSAYRAWHGDFHLDIAQCHEKYGDFVRYGPGRVIVNSNRGLQDIYGYQKNVRKSKSYLPMVPQKGAWSTLTMIDKKTHQERRRVVSRALSDAALKLFEPLMLDHIKIFLRELSGPLNSDGWSRPKNMSALCMRLTLDVMCDFGFGQKVSLQTDRSLDYIPQVLQNYSWRMGIYEQYPKLAKLNVEGILEFFGLGIDLKTRFETWSNAFESVVMNRLDGKEKGQFTLIRDYRDSTGRGFQDSELRAEGAFLILAGSDTTAIAMSAIFFYLAIYPDIYAKLADEIRRTFSDASEICSGEKLLSCKYLSACISETLRICPPVPGVPWREVEDGGVVVDGEFIPAGYNVGSSMYSIQHNASYFPSPYSFKPDRWLASESSDEQRSLAYTAFNPFSLGPRGCAGRSMALLELNLLVAHTLLRYDFKLVDGPLAAIGRGSAEKGSLRSRENEYQLFANVTSYCEGPWITFKENSRQK